LLVELQVKVDDRVTIVKELIRCTSEVFFARVTTTTILEDSVPYRRLNKWVLGLRFFCSTAAFR
jgi:hypothetical protein